MKRSQRINRATWRRPKRPNRLIPIALVLVAGLVALQLAVVGIAATGAGLAGLSYYRSVTTAGLAKLRHAPLLADVQPTRILDRHGHLLWEVSDSSRGLHQNVPLKKIPRYLQEAVIATEDHTFYTNPGIDPKALSRAVLVDLTSHGVVEGASTITQQIVKRLVLTSEQSKTRKIQEAMIAYAVAQPHSGFSKDYILSLYLNSVFFGHEAYGVEAAARVFFNRHVWQLDLAQSAFLAGLVQSPSYFDPLAYGPQRALDRMNIVLDRMLAEGYITADQKQAALAEGNHFVFSEPGWTLTTSPSRAPYWTDWIKNLVTFGPASALNNGWYTDPTLAEAVTEAGGFASGLTITTTLDLKMYDQAQQIMRQQVSYLAGQNVKDAAVVVIDPKTSQCLAMVGGVDYNSTDTGSKLNMAAVPRSPGSSFKAFTYLTAFKQGWSPSTMILDQPKSWPDPSSPGGVYAPSNYDLSWHGAVTVRMALANSYNMPAVRTIDAVGIPNVLQTAEDMGLTYLKGQEKRAGLSLTLGSLGVPLWQMAQAYNVIANGGVFHPMVSVLSISDAQGKVIYTHKPDPGIQVIAPQYAYLLTNILEDNYARRPAFGYDYSMLRLANPVAPAAVKTGTSQDFRDNLTIGFTPNLLMATWVGNPDYTPMNNIEGVDGAGPIWHDFMEWAIANYNLPVQDFTPPPGIILARVSSSGYLASSRTAWPITDIFAAGSVPHTYDPGTGENYLRYRTIGYDFSINGGTTLGPYNGPVPYTSNVSPGSLPLQSLQGPQGTISISGSIPISGTRSGFSGILPQRPSDPNLCGGRYYTYVPTYVNGQLMWRYTCQ
ncbi:MAG TPA: transglycosylase domain-containing protein [Chloroflexota bacterium]|nr:transglycosylase domain-containing protein [Chloroflexota bacterium]